MIARHNATAHAPEPARQDESGGDLSSLLYISHSKIPPRDAVAGVHEIVATGLARNPTLGLTGALLFTGEHFAQVLEGSSGSIAILMTDICSDPRHEQILVVHQGILAERRFANWSLAYLGPSQFVSRHVTRLLNEPSPAQRRRAAEWLNDLMWEFTAGPGALP